MKHFNLSGWAVGHPALILFLIFALGAAGLFSYQRLGRAEDPFFTVKVVNVSAMWPGATAEEMQMQVHIEGYPPPFDPPLSVIAENVALIEQRLRDANCLDLLDHLRAAQRKTPVTD